MTFEQRFQEALESLEDKPSLAVSIFELARAINRLAATQEKPKSKGAVSFTTAHFEDQVDAQTEALRELSRQQGEGGEDSAA